LRAAVADVDSDLSEQEVLLAASGGAATVEEETIMCWSCEALNAWDSVAEQVMCYACDAVSDTPMAIYARELSDDETEDEGYADDDLNLPPGLSPRAYAEAASSSVPLDPEELRQRKRTNIAREILASERSYLEVLSAMVEVYRTPLIDWVRTARSQEQTMGAVQKVRKRVAKTVAGSMSVREEDIKRMFANAVVIKGVHEKLIKDLEAKLDAWRDEQTLGDVFAAFAPFLRIYVDYSNNYREATELLTKYQENSVDFNATAKQLEVEAAKRCKVVGLENMLIQPIQRIPRYTLLLSDLLSKTPEGHPDHEGVSHSLAEILKVSAVIDENIHSYEQQQRLLHTANKIGAKKAGKLIRADRKLIRDGIVSYVAAGDTKVAKRLHIWLFNDMLAHVADSKGHSSIASDKHQWPLELVWLVDGVDAECQATLRNADKYRFGMQLLGPRHEYRLRFRTELEQREWFAVIEQHLAEVLDAQGEQCSVTGSRRVGAYTFRDGSQYEGEWRDGCMHGRGRWEMFGNVYEGDFETNQRHGNGTLTYVTGQRYEGQWADDRPHGVGKLTLPDGTQYEGGMRDGLRHGTGTLRFRNGDRYEGEFELNSPHGTGTFESPGRRQRYTGAFRCGLPHGTGTLHNDMADAVYAGQFEDGLRSGEGNLTLRRQGISYSGQWQVDRRNGAGIEARTNADNEIIERYEGEWVNDQRDGQGTADYADGTQYVGGWKRGRYHGQGTLTNDKIGSVKAYKGEWSHGQMRGKGVVHYHTGFIFAGALEAGVPRGEGILTAPNNAKVDSRWNLDALPEGRSSLWKEDEHRKLVKFSGNLTPNLMIRAADLRHAGVDVLAHPSIFHFPSL
jgi:hypothetical protein